VSEPWRVEVSSRAQRDLRRLPDRIATAVVEFVTGALVENPARLSKPLRNEFAGYRSARRGDYRVLIRIDECARALLIVRVDHRSHVYRAP
jgi:mRNA-degrading endonuclease RelE of RelBE toxin-antitoxin system